MVNTRLIKQFKLPQNLIYLIPNLTLIMETLEREVEYLGSGVSFFFEYKEDIYHVMINESGHVGVYMGDIKSWQFKDWLNFKDKFPQFEEIVTAITVKKLNLANKAIAALEYDAAIKEVNNNMYC
jgi:hypothetical protein